MKALREDFGDTLQKPVVEVDPGSGACPPTVGMANMVVPDPGLRPVSGTHRPSAGARTPSGEALRALRACV